jgi:PleD family two-component response regulator
MGHISQETLLDNKRSLFAFEAPEMAEEKKSVIVVDAEESIRIMFRGILEKAGYLVDTAENGQKALEKAQAKR